VLKGTFGCKIPRKILAELHSFSELRKAAAR